jgi:hypothetical protein
MLSKDLNYFHNCKFKGGCVLEGKGYHEKKCLSKMIDKI